MPAGADQMDFRMFARTVGTVMTYGVGDAIFREKDAPRYMYIVLTGEVEMRSHDRIIETIHEGNALGILSLLDEQPRTATAVARTECELAIIDRKKFRYMVEEMPHFVWYVMGELAHRLRATNAML
jgi:CRP/FNR family transcriptional regulator, cyclic AMP receptor protein